MAFPVSLPNDGLIDLVVQEVVRGCTIVHDDLLMWDLSVFT
jgi:hypothetical protein